MIGILCYSVLSLISMIFFVYSLWKKQDKKIIALYTFSAGIIYIFEYIVLVLFKSYMYRPGILSNTYYDNILGSIPSNAFSVPMIGVFVTVFQLSWLWKVLAVVLFCLIEELFLFLKIYEHFWWQTPFTAAGIGLFMFIINKWYTYLQVKITEPVRFITLYLTNILLKATLVFILVAFFRLFHYEIGWFEDKARDHLAFSTLYISILAIFFTSLVFSRVRRKWLMAGILLTVMMDWFLLKNGILIISSYWTFVYIFLLRYLLVLFLEYFNRTILYDQ